MTEDFMEISKEDIENVENALKTNSDYKLKNSRFDVKSFEKGKDIIIIQYVANIENELVFSTYEENGKYYITNTFELFIDKLRIMMNPSFKKIWIRKKYAMTIIMTRIGFTPMNP